MNQKTVTDWRPEDWNKIKFHDCMNLTNGGGDYADIYEVFEAGASAILKELVRLDLLLA